MTANNPTSPAGKTAGKTLVKCPTCGKDVEWTEASPWRPFCSERCRMIDLGSWADESHRIPADTQDDFSDTDPDVH